MNNKTVLIAGLVILIVGFATYTYINGSQNNSAPTEQQNTQTVPSNEPPTMYTMTEVSPHNNKNDCWLIIENKVYDVTQFIPQHPGGDKILSGCGKDATTLFQGNPMHGQNNAAALLPNYYIGDLQ